MADQSAKVVITAQNATAPGIRSAQRDLQGLQKQAQAMSASLGAMAKNIGLSVGVTAGVAAVRQFVTSTITLADSLNKTAAQTGMTVEQLSLLRYAAQQADVDFGTLSGALVKFNRNIAEAGTGNKSAAQAFTQLGISLETVKALKPQDLFLLVAQRISELGSEADRTKAQVDLFGRSGADLDPLFRSGAEGINKTTAAAKALGAEISGNTTEKVAALGDKADELKSKWDAFATNILGRSAPTIIKALELIEKQASRPFFERFLRNLTGATVTEAISAATGIGQQADGSFRGLIDRSRRTPARGRQLITPEDTDKANKEAQRQADYWQNTLYEMNAFERKFAEDMAERAKDYADDTLAAIERENEDRRDAHDNWMAWKRSEQEQLSVMSMFAEQAARNMQDAFAQFLFDPFKGGLKGMLAGFIDMVRRMVAELAAQSMLKAFFSWMSGGTGVIAEFGKFALKSFTGKAIGGPVMGRTPYIVGERGPELFVPNSGGTIVPNNAMGGGVTVAPVYNVDARGASADLIKSLPAILEANTRRAVELARATIYDDYSRGAFGRA